MKLPQNLKPYEMDGLTLRALTRADVPQMLLLQELVMTALPDPRWYYPSDEEEFTGVADAQEGFGYFDATGTLCGFAELTPGENREHRGYAEKLGCPQAGSFDFHDVMVRPDIRGRGMHTRFLRLFEQIARDAGGYAIFATVDPDNAPSWHNFEKAGYRPICSMPAYDGRIRRYYRLSL